MGQTILVVVQSCGLGFGEYFYSWVIMVIFVRCFVILSGVGAVGVWWIINLCSL